MSIPVRFFKTTWTNHPHGCLFLSALFLRLLAILFLPERIGQEHLEIAQYLLNGEGFVYEHDYPSTYLAPFYVYFLYFSLKFFSDPWNILLIKFIQIGLSALMAPILLYLGERIFDRKVGLLTAVIFLFHPFFIALPATLVIDAFLIPWVYSLVFLVVFWGSSWNGFKALSFGILSGIALLTKMRSLAFLLPLWGWMLIQHLKRSGGINRSLFFLMIGTCFLVIAPWSLRNYQITGSFGLEHNFGYNFWMGSNAKANGLGKYTAEQTRFPRSPALANKLDQAKNDRERNSIFLKEGMDFWRSNPWQGIGLTVKKIALFWWTDTANPRAQGMLYWFPALFISLSALAGLAYPGPKWRAMGGVLLIILGLHYLSVIMTFYIARLRLSVEPILFLYAAAFWRHLIPTFRRSSDG